MNRKEQEQVNLYRRYLVEIADRSPSRLVRDQIRRWIERCDAAQRGERDERPGTSEEMNRLRAA